MNVIEGRIGRFVKAARSLLIVQAVAALLAVALSIWAFVEVREMAAERDRLQTHVLELERDRAAHEALSTGLPPDAIPMSNLGEAELPFAIPVPVPMTDPNVIAPVEPAVPVEPLAEAPPEEPAVAADCAGADANSPRCRPGRWTTIPRRPPIRIPEPTRPDTNQQAPPAPN